MSLNRFVAKETIHTQAVRCQTSLTMAALSIATDDRTAAIEQLHLASEAIDNILNILDELRERPPMEGT
tara:strand:- start:7 stop:213 length:207 start_codon:yes stop_codon:yes gene_type:complete